MLSLLHLLHVRCCELDSPNAKMVIEQEYKAGSPCKEMTVNGMGMPLNCRLRVSERVVR